MQIQLPQIRDAILAVLNSLNMELYDLNYTGNARKGVLRVIIDKPGGVTLEDCERASRNISPVLDVYNFIDQPYVLEVSSPGLDRPLKKIEDFQRVRGSLIRVKTMNFIHDQKIFTGRLISVKENGTIDLLLDEKKPKMITILFENISEANLEVEWMKGKK